MGDFQRRVREADLSNGPPGRGEKANGRVVEVEVEAIVV